ncbi:MAG: hypothetical protein A3J83_00750 [Elusimicrobia bacterium RIFOXYA2_FULL_40_6]|nr:MAG: hypothetical protein A3J83_00750 [Elusimicrobia bacterium RIFOXYA2_FULL_40_6]
MNFETYLIIFATIILVERGAEILFFHKGKIKGKLHSDWTTYLMPISYLIFVIAVVVEYLVIKREMNMMVTAIGLSLWISRFFIKFWGARTLGKFWSSHIEIRDSHKLVNTGPYKYLRHPVYFSNIIDFIGLPMITNSYYVLFSGTIIMILLMILRIPFEEKALISKLGDEYKEYQKETYAVIPFIF